MSEKAEFTGVSYYRARYYDPQAGRFGSEDPMEFYGGFNFYRYALNSSVGLRDPFGLCPTGICKSPVFEPQYLKIFSDMGKDLNVDPHFIMAVAIHESGYNLVHVYGTNKSSHGKPLNNLFGSTYAGRDNIAYPSVEASALIQGVGIEVRASLEAERVLSHESACLRVVVSGAIVR